MRYLLNVHSDGSFSVKVKRLDPLNVLLFLLTLKWKIVLLTRLYGGKASGRVCSGFT